VRDLWWGYLEYHVLIDAIFVFEYIEHEKLTQKRPVNEPGSRWKGNIKMNIKEVGWVCVGVRTVSFGLEWELVVGCQEYSHETLGSVKGGALLDLLRECLLLETDSDPCSWLITNKSLFSSTDMPVKHSISQSNNQLINSNLACVVTLLAAGRYLLINGMLLKHFCIM